MNEIPEYEAVRKLGEEFGRVGREMAEQQAEMAEQRARRARRRRRVYAPVVGTGLAILVVGGGVGVSLDAFDHDGGSLPHESQVPAGVRRSNWKLAEAKAKDPVERAPWGMSIYSTASGSTCAVAGRVVDGRLGQLQSGTFRELPADKQGTCADLMTKHVLSVIRFYGAAGERTVFFGVADRTVSALALRKGSRMMSVPIAADGTFMVVFKGARTLRAGALRVTSVDGTTRWPYGRPSKLSSGG